MQFLLTAGSVPSSVLHINTGGLEGEAYARLQIAA